MSDPRDAIRPVPDDFHPQFELRGDRVTWHHLHDGKLLALSYTRTPVERVNHAMQRALRDAAWLTLEYLRLGIPVPA